MKRESITGRWLLGLLWPGGGILLAVWAFQLEDIAVGALAPYAKAFGFVALGAAALLSWYFNYGRVFFVAAAASLTAFAVDQPGARDATQKLAAIVLLPANLALFAWLKERGVATAVGAVRVGLIAAEVAAVALLPQWTSARLESFLRWGGADGWTWLPGSAQITFALAAIVILALVLVRRTKAEQDLLWVIVIVFIGLHLVEQPGALFFYFGAAGIVLLLGVLERGYHIAYRDELTGILGRRALNDVIGRLGGTYAIAMCDVDHFKKFNDTYGHDAGDQVLRMVAVKLSRIHGGGRVFRYGGEEFAVVFRGRTMKQAQPFLEAVREAIAASKFTLRRPDRPAKKPELDTDTSSKQVVTITISIGVAEGSKVNTTPDLVIDAADAALYRAKQAGRNCVMLEEKA